MSVSFLPGLYIHIPFCDTKCGYCDFYSVTDDSAQPEFIGALCTEIRLAAGDHAFRRPVDTIYFGGGTPSLLKAAEIEKILLAVFDSYTITADCEITLETNPGTVDYLKLYSFKKAGINRLSIGIQSFSDEELKFLGRIHDAGQAKNTLKIAERAGFDNVSIDLIYALPGQTLTSWKQSLKTAMEYQPRHISAYNLIFEPGTPFFRQLQHGKMHPLPEDLEVGFFNFTKDFLNEAGYDHYEISNYAAGPKYLSRHNYKYWNHVEYRGFGPSAHSFIDKRRFSNVRSVKHYIEKIRSGANVVDFEESLSRQQIMFEHVYLHLRTQQGVHLPGFRARFHKDFKRIYAPLINQLLDNRLAVFSNFYFKFTRKGMLLSDEILPEFSAV